MGRLRRWCWCRRRRIVRRHVRTDRSEQCVTGIRVVPLRVERFRYEGHGHGDGDLPGGELRFRRAVAVEERVLQQPRSRAGKISATE